MRSLSVPLVLALALALPAAAQPVAPTEPAPTIVYAKTSAVEFIGVDVVGTLQMPTGTFTVVPGARKFRNLIELRANFRPELARSASRLPSTLP